MRLLEDSGQGNLSLVEKHDDDIPRYAILSHTWGADGDEVTFRDLTEGIGRNKAGYRKIEFCRAQAASDGLQYFWVDTCCIDKSSSAELSEAINSMFRWYRNAYKCYVYLPDVSTAGEAVDVQPSSTVWETAFRRSRWFTRGWTLQELIAPISVEFFSQEHDRLGSKQSLEETIHRITGIAIEALRGAPLMGFRIEDRFSWANHRATKRQEDKAYSLLGLFDIYMPLLYGEGEERAFVRLREEISKSLNRQGDRTEMNQPNHLLRISTLQNAPGQSTPMKKLTYYLGELSGHTNVVWRVRFSPDGATIASGSSDKSVRIWDAATGRQLRKLGGWLSGHAGPVYSVGFSPDGASIVSGSGDKTIKIWDTGTGSLLRELSSHSDPVFDVAFSPKGTTIASGSGDKSIRIWHAGTGRQLRELSGHTDTVYSVAFSTKATNIASGSGDWTVRIWDTGTGAQLRELRGHIKSVQSVVFSPDGATIASGSLDNTVRIWDVGTGRQIRELSGHTDSVQSVVFSPDGATIASGSTDKTVRIWDVGTGKLQQKLSDHTDWVRGVAFSPDGAIIASASDDKSVSMWDANIR